MNYNFDIHHRRSIRLKGYDYSKEWLYFITTCTQNQLYLFGEIEKGEMILNDAGIMIKTVWHEIPEYYNEFNVHEFIVMPNHVHGIIQIISNPVGAGPRACPICCPTHTYPVCTHPINELQQTNGQPPTNGQPRGGCPYDVIIRCYASV